MERKWESEFVGQGCCRWWNPSIAGVGGLIKREESVEGTTVETTMVEKTEVSTTQETVIFVDIKGEVKKPESIK